MFAQGVTFINYIEMKMLEGFSRGSLPILCEESQKVYFIQQLLKHSIKQKLTESWCITLLFPLNSQELKWE